MKTASEGMEGDEVGVGLVESLCEGPCLMCYISRVWTLFCRYRLYLVGE